MARPARIARSRLGAEQRHGGQPVHESAGQQHHQLLQLEQLEYDLQRQRAGQHATVATAQRYCARVHGRRSGLLPDRYLGVGIVEHHRFWGRDLPARRALRAAQARQDHERIRAQGCRRGNPLPGRASVPRYGYGGNAVSIPRGNWQTGHVVVATKPRVETRLCNPTA